MTTTLSKCKSCNAQVMWLLTLKGRTIPLDRDPVPDGNMFVKAGKAIPIKYLVAGTEPGPLYKSHFATCPQAGAWRKKDKKGKPVKGDFVGLPR